ncbi:hypothetical protein SAMN05428981_11024 [Bacillus sp. OV194]|nr:hypothetical protein SAMN05428981_11024 [Bacillus sp. OV194]
MTVNHGGSLGKAYFLAYLKLIMNARNCSLELAHEIAMELFFYHDKTRYGNETYTRFVGAYKELNGH